MPNPPLTEEEFRRCCLLGGCGCSSAASQAEALSAQMYEGTDNEMAPCEEAARWVLENYDLVPKGAGRLILKTFDGPVGGADPLLSDLHELYTAAGYRKHR